MNLGKASSAASTGKLIAYIFREWEVDVGYEFPALCEFTITTNDNFAPHSLKVEPIGGHIMIDGIDIHKIGLYDLRSRIVSFMSECHT